MNIPGMIQDVLKREGGFVNNPADHGGPTNMGITLATLQRNKAGATVADLQALTTAQAGAIYLAEYYYAPGINKLPEPLQAQVFDIAVNSGPGRAIRLLQGVLGVPQDGLLGGVTCDTAVATIASHGAPYVTNRLVDARCLYLRGIAYNTPSQAVFLNGWLTRANSFRV